MNPDVVCAEPGMSAEEVLNLLLDRDVADAPVVSDDGRIIGLISQNALIRHVEAPATASETGRFFTDDDEYRDIGETSDSRTCLLYTSPSPRDLSTSRMPSSA